MLFHGVIIIIIIIIINPPLLVPIHKISNVDAVWEPFDVLLPRVITITQPPLKPSTTILTAGFISVLCNEMTDRQWPV